jgi:hypothetical protein
MARTAHHLQGVAPAHRSQAGAHGNEGYRRNRLRKRFVPVLSRTCLVASIIAAGLAAGCTTSAKPTCTPKAERLAASRRSSLIAVVPRTSRSAATWGLRELAKLLPFVASGGLELHVLYSQDSDDLVEGGGDGGPPQVLLTSVPDFPAVHLTGAPASPPDPTTLSASLYCGRLASWQAHTVSRLQAETARRAALAAAWARTAGADLRSLARKPIPDTSGSEAGVEIDASASVFTAAQVAQAAPKPTIVFLGGLTSLRPPSLNFRFPARLVALVRSTDPGQVLRAEANWARWARRAGGSFEAVSANDAPAQIARALSGPGGVR